MGKLMLKFSIDSKIKKVKHASAKMSFRVCEEKFCVTFKLFLLNDQFNFRKRKK